MTNYKNCLYQAYGDSPIYGRDVLLYLGQTNDYTRRTIEHLGSDFERIPNLHLITGVIDERVMGELGAKEALDLCESLLITMLKPSYNSSNIKDTGKLLKAGKKFLLLNQGNRGDLPLEVSNIWW